MGLLANKECINEESCYRWIEPWNLYEIVLLKGFSGAIYLLWRGNTFYEWTHKKWGFRHLNNCDWLLHCTAPLNSFAEWQHAYYKLLNRKNTKYLRANLWQEFDELRKQVDPESGKHEQSGAPIPF
jgi:hypothetical protein